MPIICKILLLQYCSVFIKDIYYVQLIIHANKMEIIFYVFMASVDIHFVFLNIFLGETMDS